MDYKKKYENVLPYIKDLIEHNVISTESAGKYFPELKENEDERMWKLIKKYAHYNISDLALEADHITREQLETWLEKQGGQKQETSYPKFNFDDILAIQCCMETAEKVTEDKELYEMLKSLHSRLHDAYWLEKQGEQKQDPCNNCKDVMLNCHNFPCVKKRAFKQGKSVLEVINEEQVDNANKVEPAWSEEDKKILDELITFFVKMELPKDHDFRIYASWLKALKDRVGCEANCTTAKEWKPSDEQIKAVRLARSFVTDDFGENHTLSDVLVELEKQLKKLK